MLVKLPVKSIVESSLILFKKPPLGEPASGRLMEVTTIGEHLEGWPQGGCSHLMKVQMWLMGV